MEIIPFYKIQRSATTGQINQQGPQERKLEEACESGSPSVFGINGRDPTAAQLCLHRIQLPILNESHRRLGRSMITLMPKLFWILSQLEAQEKNCQPKLWGFESFY